MKVTINLKKETPFKKLFVKTVEKEMYEKIKTTLKNKGADDDKISSFIKENDYNGKISFPFDLMCSKQTWDAVERYAELDAKIDFGINEKGYCFAKINIENSIEQVISYTPSTEQHEDVVTSWACGAIPESKKVIEAIVETPTQPSASTGSDLPF